MTPTQTATKASWWTLALQAAWMNAITRIALPATLRTTPTRPLKLSQSALTKLSTGTPTNAQKGGRTKTIALPTTPASTPSLVTTQLSGGAMTEAAAHFPATYTKASSRKAETSARETL